MVPLIGSWKNKCLEQTIISLKMEEDQTVLQYKLKVDDIY